MRKAFRITLTTLILLWSNWVFSQTTIHLSQNFQLFFDFDKSELRVADRDSMLSITKGLVGSDSLSISLLGHTDSKGSDAYNLALSERRVKAVREALADSAYDEYVEVEEYCGEASPIGDNKTPEGRQLNRRVDVIFDYYHFIDVQDSCDHDTTVSINGVQLTMNICDYEREKECLDVTTYYRPEDLAAAGLTTETADGEPLISGGMMEITKCSDACIQVRMPVRPAGACMANDGMSLWGRSENGGWSADDRDVETVQENDSLFFVFRSCRSEWLNCDKRTNINKEKPTTTVVSRKLKMVSASIVYNDPLFAYSVDSEEPSERFDFYIPCPCDSALINVTAIDQQGDTQYIYLEPINNLKHRKWFRGCKEDIRKRFLFLKFHDKSIYRKYILKPDDFREMESVKAL